MTDNEKPSNNPQSLNVLTQFLKDLSFENPANGPLFVGEKNVSPEINLNVQINVEKDTNEKTHFYVSLNLKAISKIKEKPLFILDITYTGLFKIVGFEDNILEQILNVQCPTLLFPYVRHIISEKVIEGGFPPLFIDPIDFYGIYIQRKKEAEQIDKKDIH